MLEITSSLCVSERFAPVPESKKDSEVYFQISSAEYSKPRNLVRAKDK